MQNNLNDSSLNAKENLSTELRFLVNCCKTDPSEEDINLIQNTLSTIDHQLLTSMANHHGILPLVYKTLKNLHSDHQSSTTNHEILSAFKKQYLIIAQRNILMSAELIRIMKLLKENGIEAIAFKGPTLAQIAYDDITLRQYGDLDILTRKKDIYKIDTLLKTQGYERLLSLTDVQEELWIENTHDLSFSHPKKAIYLEMHWSFLDEDYPLQVKLEDFWEETQILQINGHTVSTFSNENMLLYLCIHGSKHLWERIEWIIDLDLLIRKNEIDWKELMKKTEGTGFEKMVYLGLSLSTSLFNTLLPEIILKQIANYPEIDDISKFILESWQNPKNTIEETGTMLKLFPGVKEQTLYLHKVILKPSLNEYRYVDLSKRFYWGYYLIRPYLLMKKYLTKS